MERNQINDFSEINVPNVPSEKMRIYMTQKNEDIIHDFETSEIKKGSGEYKENIETKTNVNGSKYKGYYSNGLRYGKGIYYYKNGDVYAGDWKNDEFNGYGIYIYASQERYEGELKNGKKHGKGTYYYFNGSYYNGMWALDKKNGQGTYQYTKKGILSSPTNL